MIKIPDPGRGIARRLVRSLGLAAAALFALSATPGQRAEALSLINPGAMSAAKYASEGLTTKVRGGHGGGGGGHHGGGGGFHGGGGGGFHGGFRGGGAVFHGGGFRSGGAVFHGGGLRTAHVFRGGGFRHSGFAFRHHRHVFYGASYYPYYDYPYYSSYRRCHIVWTYYGPRRVCHYRHWRHHHWRHHHRRHHHYAFIGEIRDDG
jgi:hypothetical protein